jgi:hypothetical protein
MEYRSGCVPIQSKPIAIRQPTPSERLSSVPHGHRNPTSPLTHTISELPTAEPFLNAGSLTEHSQSRQPGDNPKYTLSHWHALGTMATE